jgi:hypothetical protein
VGRGKLGWQEDVENDLRDLELEMDSKGEYVIEKIGHLW